MTEVATYVIETDDRRYYLQAAVAIGSDGFVRYLTIGDSVRFAVEKKTAYIKLEHLIAKPPQKFMRRRSSRASFEGTTRSFHCGYRVLVKPLCDQNPCSGRGKRIALSSFLGSCLLERLRVGPNLLVQTAALAVVMLGGRHAPGLKLFTLAVLDRCEAAGHNVVEQFLHSFDVHNGRLLVSLRSGRRRWRCPASTWAKMKSRSSLGRRRRMESRNDDIHG